MTETYCDRSGCPVGVPHAHPTDEEMVKLTIHPDMVEDGLWNSDCCARYAIAMDDDRGRIVWHRSADWRTYAMHNGFTRIARISPEMPCDKANH